MVDSRCMESCEIVNGSRTYSGMSLLADNENAFDKSSAGVVDALKHRLHKSVTSSIE